MRRVGCACRRHRSERAEHAERSGASPEPSSSHGPDATPARLLRASCAPHRRAAASDAGRCSAVAGTVRSATTSAAPKAHAIVVGSTLLAMIADITVVPTAEPSWLVMLSTPVAMPTSVSSTAWRTSDDSTVRE